MTLPAAARRDLAEALDPPTAEGPAGADAALLVDEAVTRSYGTDWTRRWSSRPLAVLRPTSHDAVAAVLEACARHDLAVVPQGGNTGLVGGSVPGADDDAVVLSLTGLRRAGSVDRRTRQVTVDAGVHLVEVQRRARESGLVYGVDLAARDSATIGGTVATNAGGLRVCRYGDTRAQVRGVRVVLAGGATIDRLHALPKDGAGYDLTQLVIGSEGTLGVVTAVSLALHEPDPPGATTLVGCPSMAAALDLLPGSGLRMAEVMTEDGMAVTCDVTGLPPPLQRSWPAYLLIQTDDVPDLPDGTDAVVDDRLVEYRERHPEAIATLGVVHKYDVAVPAGALDAVVDEVRSLLPGYRVLVYGHLAEANMHVNVVGPEPGNGDVDETVLAAVASAGGSIASEHGVGRAKAALLHLTRADADRDAMWAIKRALDPAGLLNPGAVLV